MSTSNEKFWQQEAFHKKQIHKWELIVFLGLMVLITFALALITQPLFLKSQVRKRIPSVNSSKLEAHVRMMAEEIFPRDGGHPRNLDRAAAYIHQNLSNAKGVVTEQPYEAVMITDTAFFRNKRYHSIRDTPDTLDYKRMALVIQSVYAAVLEIAQE
jgi:hypothetical protein